MFSNLLATMVISYAKLSGEPLEPDKTTFTKREDR